jgi:crotonobetainyl-CoA:carnitine CoA-transferase CaiB-like acyl-CoA transferase
MKNGLNNMLPLQEVRILDLTRLIPGAVCTSILGDAGAEVIKVEEPHIGDYERQIHPFIGSMASRFLILNRNKKSIALNLKAVKGKEIFLDMVKKADVLIEGFRPDAMKKLQLDYESVKHINPRLIYCSISSFGQDGPYRDVVAHDITVLGMAGFFDITGVKGGAPIIPGIQIADSIAGTNAALAILLALMARANTGKGQAIDISMFDGIMSWMFDAARYAFAEKPVPKRGEGRLWGGLPNYNLYKTKDGKFIAVGSLESKFKKILLKKLGRDDCAEKETETTSSKIKQTDEELHTFMNRIFLTKTRDEWIKELDELNICVGPVNSVEEALSHRQTTFRDMLREVYHPSAGRIKQLGSPLKFSDIQLNENRLPAPQKGEHTREILSELGYPEASINELVKENIVGESESK